MKEPRIGDTVIDATRMEPFVVTGRGAEAATAKDALTGRRRRRFRFRDLELIDYDEGLWQEMEREDGRRGMGR